MNRTSILLGGALLVALICLINATPASAQYGYGYGGVQVYVGRPAAAYAAYPYAAYPYGVYNPRRAYRQAVRYGYGPPVVGVYAYPYYGYPSHPLYGPVPYSQSPTPAVQRPQMPLGSTTSEPVPTLAPAPEAIPAPPSEPGVQVQ